MPRKREVPKRHINPDPKFKDQTVAKFINVLMYDGKRSVAERIVYGAFDKIAQRTGDDPVRGFKKAIDNIKPQLEVRSRRVGGATYQVPVEVRPRRATTLAILKSLEALEVTKPSLEIIAVDNSAAMLSICVEQLSREEESVRSRAHLIQADMRDFKLGPSFRLVMIPTRAFQHLLFPGAGFLRGTETLCKLPPGKKA